MDNKLYYFKRNMCLIGVLVGLFTLFSVVPAKAVKFDVAGKPMEITGYVNQGIAYGLKSDKFDTMDNINSMVFQALLEVGYQFNNELKFFGSGNLNIDWMYAADGFDSSDWKDKKFDESDDLEVLDEFGDILKEFHVTWTPGDFYIRVGKQIVSWGEMDAFRIMDQINPVDQRRGVSDVEFESTIIPIWLLNASYFMPVDSSWLEDLEFQFVFNPNADFRGNEGLFAGNDASGVWGANVEAGPNIYLGSFISDIEEPDEWDTDGFEYGIRLRAMIKGSLLSLHYFYGIDNDAVIRLNGAPVPEISDWDRSLILHLPVAGYYPRFKMAGLTFTKDFENLYIDALGGVAPTLRLETFYSFNKTFSVAPDAVGLPLDFDKFDELRWGVGIDWKVKINWLNPRANIMISPQFFQRRIQDYPDAATLVEGADGHNVWETMNSHSLILQTSYFHNKLTPTAVWIHEHTNKANFLKFQLLYEHSHVWNYTLGVLSFQGYFPGNSYHAFRNKDQIYFTISYRF